MRENAGHLFADVLGQLFQSLCVKCGITVDKMKVRHKGATVPKCSYAYPAPAKKQRNCNHVYILRPGQYQVWDCVYCGKVKRGKEKIKFTRDWSPCTTSQTSDAF